MDVSTSNQTETRLAVFREIHCNVCGYPRTGLPEGALCPECGTPPPKLIAGLSVAAGAAQDRSDQAWLASIGIGLVLLVVSSYFALQVSFMTPIGGLTVAAVNAPAPKLCAAALLMRSIGNPGEWGVLGTIAVLGNVLAIWLITEPRSILATEESMLSARRLTRWTCIITTGGLLGVLLSGYDVQSVWWGWYSLPILVVSLVLVELPTNTLLYLHLSQLAKRFDGGAGRGRAGTMLHISTWLIAIIVASGAVISLLRGASQDQPVVPWRIVQTVYGAAALGTGMCMTLGVLQLCCRVFLATMDESMLSLASKLSWLRTMLEKMMRSIRSDPRRWAAVAGLLLWLWIAKPMIGLSAMIEHRRGLGGDLPQLNFIGPKVWAVGLLDYAYLDYSSEGNPDDKMAIVATIVAMWLITTYEPTGSRKLLRLATRWLPTILIGLAIGFELTIEQSKDQIRDSHWAAILMLGVEAPATLLAYLYLSNLAKAISQKRLSKHLWFTAFAAAAVIVSPMAFYLLAKPLRHFYDSWQSYVVGAIFGAIVVAVGIVAWALLVKLTWTLATLGVSSSGDDSPSPPANAQ